MQWINLLSIGGIIACMTMQNTLTCRQKEKKKEKPKKRKNARDNACSHSDYNTQEKYKRKLMCRLCSTNYDCFVYANKKSN